MKLPWRNSEHLSYFQTTLPDGRGLAMQTSSGLDQDQNSQTSGDALIIDGQLIKLGPTFVGESDQMSNYDTGAIELRSEGQEQGPRVDLTFRTLKIDH